MNIIIVDDDPFVTGALKTILESMGEITVKATGTDGKEACELYLGEGTVRNYLSSILDNLQLRDRTQVAIF